MSGFLLDEGEATFVNKMADIIGTVQTGSLPVCEFNRT